MAILGYNSRSQFIRSFGLEEWLKTRGLAGWLEIATDKLAAPARQRIEQEITAHYTEAVTAHMTAGESETSAQTNALAQLGDPQAAGWNFQKSHLTEFEAKSMKWMEWTAAKPFLSFWALPLEGIPLAGSVLLCSYAHQISNFWILFTAVPMAYAGFRLIPRLLCARTLPRPSFLNWLVLSNSLGYAAISAIYSLFFYVRNDDVFVSSFKFFGFFLFFGGGRSLRIWIKLRKINDERNDLPPRQPISS